jgi:hypothetical protein
MIAASIFWALVLALFGFAGEGSHKVTPSR